MFWKAVSRGWPVFLVSIVKLGKDSESRIATKPDRPDLHLLALRKHAWLWMLCEVTGEVGPSDLMPQMWYDALFILFIWEKLRIDGRAGLLLRGEVGVVENSSNPLSDFSSDVWIGGF